MRHLQTDIHSFIHMYAFMKLEALAFFHVADGGCR
jgi:hypothetical protein